MECLLTDFQTDSSMLVSWLVLFPLWVYSFNFTIKLTKAYRRSRLIAALSLPVAIISFMSAWVYILGLFREFYC